MCWRTGIILVVTRPATIIKSACRGLKRIASAPNRARSKREEAVAHFRDMIRLNPGDNQGVRYILVTMLLELGQEKELTALLKQFEDDESPYWVYSVTLLIYRREGDSARARASLADARAVNGYVPDLLIGREILPEGRASLISPGGRSEAIDYAATALRGWRATPGALDWLRQCLNATSSRASKKRESKPRAAAKGPTPAMISRLGKLEQVAEEVWQADVRELPMWMDIDNDSVRPWVILVISRSHDLILAQDLSETPPTSDVLWSKLSEALRKPAVGEPHRPAEVQTRALQPWEALDPSFDAIGVRRTVSNDLDLMDEVVKHLVTHLCGRPPAPGMLDMPGVTEDQVARFFQAAATFSRATPWFRVSGEETIKIACDRFESGPWYSVVIGQMGMTPGFALYEDLAALSKMRVENSSDETNARETVALSITYGDKTEISCNDLDASLEHGWEIAAPEAYPSVMRKERGLTMRPPLGWELQLLEACLQAIPEFITRHDRESSETFVATCETALGPLSLRLNWVLVELVDP